MSLKTVYQTLNDLAELHYKADLLGGARRAAGPAPLNAAVIARRFRPSVRPSPAAT